MAIMMTKLTEIVAPEPIEREADVAGRISEWKIKETKMVEEYGE